MGDRYYARSASDKTDHWPFWFVADRDHGGLNVTNPLGKKHLGWPENCGTVMGDKGNVIALAEIANRGN